MRNAYETLVGKPEGKRPLRTSKCRWEHNIRLDPRAIGWEVLDWIHSGQDSNKQQAVMNMVMNLQVP